MSVYIVGTTCKEYKKVYRQASIKQYIHQKGKEMNQYHVIKNSIYNYKWDKGNNIIEIRNSYWKCHYKVYNFIKISIKNN